MLYNIGVLEIDTRAFNVDEVERTAGADFAEHAVLGTLPAREFMGEGNDSLTLSGQLLPFVQARDLDHLETAHRIRRSGEPQPVMRGDGEMLGWWVIEQVSEGHRHLMRDGVGFAIRHSLKLSRVDAAAGSPAIVGQILSLFGL